MLQLGVGILRQIHLPHALVVGEEGVNGNTTGDAWFQRGAGDGERAALRSAVGRESVGVHFIE